MEASAERDAALLGALVDRWLAGDEARRGEVEDEIRARFEERLAVFVLDMSGFSATVAEQGVTRFLGKIHAMRARVVPSIESWGGEVVKYVADDVVAVFPDPSVALCAARDVVAATARAAATEELHAEVCIGIGYGEVLHVPRTDLWGDEVNRAFKLGEDTAGPGEVLLTDAAYRALDEPPPEARSIDVRVSGVVIPAWSIRGS